MPTTLLQSCCLCLQQAIIDGAAEVEHLKHVTRWIFAGHSMVRKLKDAPLAHTSCFRDMQSAGSAGS